MKHRLNRSVVIGLFVSIVTITSSTLAEPELILTTVDSNYFSLPAFIEDEKRPQRQPLDRTGKEKDLTAWAFYVDNDLLSPASQDHDYTSGFSLTLSGANAKKYPFSIDFLLNKINHWFGRNYSDGIQRHSIEFGANAFTPEDIVSADPLPDDRAYASLI